MPTRTKIKGGHEAYREAVRLAYSQPMHNPCVRWSLARGFTAESALVPADSDQYTVCLANYSANTGNPWMSGSRSEYRAVRVAIIAFQSAIETGATRDMAVEAAKDALWEHEN